MNFLSSQSSLTMQIGKLKEQFHVKGLDESVQKNDKFNQRVDKQAKMSSFVSIILSFITSKKFCVYTVTSTKTCMCGYGDCTVHCVLCTVLTSHIPFLYNRMFFFGAGLKARTEIRKKIFIFKVYYVNAKQFLELRNSREEGGGHKYS